MDRVVTISINSEHEAVMVKEPGSPQQGGQAAMEYGKHRRPGKTSRIPSQISSIPLVS